MLGNPSIRWMPGWRNTANEDYLQILDGTGRQVRSDKRGAIPGDLAPILERIGVASENRLETVSNFGRLFHRAAGVRLLLSEQAHESLPRQAIGTTGSTSSSREIHLGV